MTKQAAAPATQPREYFPPRMRTGKAAAYLGLSRRFVQQLSAEGRLPFHKIGPRCTLYDRRDLDQFLESCRVGVP